MRELAEGTEDNIHKNSNTLEETQTSLKFMKNLRYSKVIIIRKKKQKINRIT